MFERRSPRRHLAVVAVASLLASSSACEDEACPPPPSDVCPEFRAGADQSRVTWSPDPLVQARAAIVYQAAGDAAIEVPALIADATAGCVALGAALGVTANVAAEATRIERLEATCRTAYDALAAIPGYFDVAPRARRSTIRVDELIACESTCRLDASCAMAGAELRCPEAARASRCEGTCTGTCAAQGTPTTCDGVCDGECVGACDGHCVGTCDGTCEDVHGLCYCDGVCTGRCPTRCAGTCTRACDPAEPAPCDDLCLGTCEGVTREPACEVDALLAEPACELDRSCASACTILTQLARPPWRTHREVRTGDVPLDADTARRLGELVEDIGVDLDRLAVISEATFGLSDLVGTTDSGRCETAAIRASSVLFEAESAAAVGVFF